MIDFLHKLWIELLAIVHGDGIELFAVITGLLYVYLEIKQNKMMWIVGIISSLVFIYVFFDAKIYAQSAIYGYYVIISVYGYWKWSKNGELKIENGECRGEPTCSPFFTKIKKISVLVVISIILSIIIGFVLANFTDSTIPYYDGLTAGFSIVATWMLTQKIIQHWYFWMGIDIFCVPLYASQELYFTAFMFFVYFILSIIGLQQWKKDLKKVP
ncbi:MAG: nicotinamide riboside transporter PnuC [Bacteroidales bacterium]|jgi:nicotinamide mononucleotide transporter|nr:nicotinamide riboside transporter PnuC [Bacteroidales bacterium]